MSGFHNGIRQATAPSSRRSPVLQERSSPPAPDKALRCAAHKGHRRSPRTGGNEPHGPASELLPGSRLPAPPVSREQCARSSQTTLPSRPMAPSETPPTPGDKRPLRILRRKLSVIDRLSTWNWQLPDRPGAHPGQKASHAPPQCQGRLCAEASPGKSTLEMADGCFP